MDHGANRKKLRYVRRKGIKTPARDFQRSDLLKIVFYFAFTVAAQCRTLTGLQLSRAIIRNLRGCKINFKINGVARFSVRNFAVAYFANVALSRFY
jgi:hypothetical protein